MNFIMKAHEGNWEKTTQLVNSTFKTSYSKELLEQQWKKKSKLERETKRRFDKTDKNDALPEGKGKYDRGVNFLTKYQGVRASK
mmetsp:Transcript_26386/g.30515  ORF Transcript_26386/g.30515 Transcript_26386/m.30515 type:complete len:84 (+) Transcript_26386:294-545(+)